MIHVKKNFFVLEIFMFLMFLCFFEISCGVKGDPSPPLEPTFIGKGSPAADYQDQRTQKDQQKNLQEKTKQSAPEKKKD